MGSQAAAANAWNLSPEGNSIAMYMVLFSAELLTKLYDPEV
jgi:hypothetical protein